MDGASAAGLLAAFVMGLLGSGHCAGMCGGIACSLTLSLPAPVRARPVRLLPFLAAYNVGRVASYGAAGALAGAVGLGLAAALPLAATHVVGFALSGAMLLAVGAHVGGWWRPLDALERLGARPWRRIEPLGRRLVPARSPAHALALGALWGWLPCGLVYGALALAFASGSALEGALRMLAFGLGTVPMLVLVGSAAGWVGELAREPGLRRWAGACLVGLGVLTVAGAFLSHAPHDAALAGLEGLCTADAVGAPIE